MAGESLQTAANSILMLVLTLVLPALIAWGVYQFKKYTTVKAAATNNEYVRDLWLHIGETLEDVVNCTTGTYVNALKDSDSFNLEEQKKAFNLSKDTFIGMLDEEATNLIIKTHGDLETFARVGIESVLATQKLNK